MNDHQRDDTSPRTGVEHLTAALAVQDLYPRGRYVWHTIEAVEQPVTKTLIRSVLGTLAPRADLTTSERERLWRTQHGQAQDIFRVFLRGVVGAPHTIAALAKGTPSPVHGKERLSLVATLQRRITAEGYDIDEPGARKVLYTLADAVGAALAQPIVLPAPAYPSVPVQLDGPVGDHDEVDWRTGEPKLDTTAATHAALAALLAATAGVHAAAA